jgi:hypothetical protein
MIPCHDTENAACYESTIDSPAFLAGQNVLVGLATAATDEEPRMVEILTVLNDVFDSIGSQSESGVFRTPWPA